MKMNRLILALVLTSATAHAQRPARRTTATSHRRLAQRATAPAVPAVPRPTSSASPPVAPVAQPAPSASPGAPLNADQVVARVQAFYDATSDFAADFEQISRSMLSGTTQRSTGHLQFRKPGKMRFDYTTPAGNVVVSDGTTLWAYEAAQHQAIQTSLVQSQLPSALSFLTGTGRLVNDFTFRLLPSATAFPGGYVLELRPITPNPSFERVVFYVEGQHFQVASTVLIDAQGNTNRFNFLAPRVNLNPALTVFQWSPPAGTQVVRP